ncbi:unnamed protein product [Calypogeia fissa]
MSSGKAVKLALADGILTFAWTLVTSGLGAAALVLGDYLDWKGDRTPIVYAIILVVNLIFVELSVASGGAAWNPTAPMAFYVSGVGEDTLFSLAMRIPSMAIGAAAGVWAVHELMPGTYRHTLGPGPNLKVDLHQGALVEGVFTFVLTLIVLYTVLRGTKNRFLQTPIIVACALTLVMFAGGYTGPAMNPSDAFGWAYFNGRHTSVEHIYVYWVMPFIGALFAAGVYRLLLSPASSPSPRPSSPPTLSTSTPVPPADSVPSSSRRRDVRKKVE